MVLATGYSPDFTLPSELEAREPPEARGLERDEVRLLVSYAATDCIVHAAFRDLPRFLEPGDLLIANDSATLPAAVNARGPEGEAIVLHFSTRMSDDVWVVEPRRAQMKAGDTLALDGDGLVMLLSPYRDSSRLWLARLFLPEPALDYLGRWGRPIAYDYVTRLWPLDAYQTVYARTPGSAEMPSAGRAFSRRVLDDVARLGVGFETLTLHTGVSSLENDEHPYPEWFSVPQRTAEAISAARAGGHRIIAIGTTVVRALESAARQDRSVQPRSGWTELVITPERGVTTIDGLLTGLHEPRSSHLAMLEAIGDRRHTERAYGEAIEAGYLWHEFGDLHLILR
jgi:S-adenosylmethionine:tRNA ribosyltransferase-isomerase